MNQQVGPRLVFFLEEVSAKAFLQELMARLSPDGPKPLFITFEGKQDMMKELPRKLRGWRGHEDALFILMDQDSADCRAVKNRLVDMCAESGRPDAVVRIVCRQLEAWFIADLDALAQVFRKQSLASMKGKAKFRDPDGLGDPYREIKREVPSFQKVSGARLMGRHIAIREGSSASFNALLRALKRHLGSGNP